ncbi:MAG: hypothetical protein IJV69_06875 [Kiritimatiellae bacterium]|nr:hypothetical protein [Kiritimatiellia bacterium]
MFPVNLYFDVNGQTVLRYWRTNGTVAERRVDFPAHLLTSPEDPLAEVKGRALETPSAVLFAAFRQIPLAPGADWELTGQKMSVCYQATFAALLRMMRLPVEKRWCVRGEPGWFLQFGFQETDGSYTLGAFVLPCGKPAVLTFRLEDVIDTLPPEKPFQTADIHTEADGLLAQWDYGLPWDTRVRLPIADNGAALIRVIPNEMR